MGDYDLIMVGRCHENEPKVLSGLSERIHSRELGPLGGVLASENIFSLVSVQVAQQQIMKARHSSTFNQWVLFEPKLSLAFGTSKKLSSSLSYYEQDVE